MKHETYNMNHKTYSMKQKRSLHASRCMLHDNKGFTLIEAVVSAALFAVVVSAILGVYLSTLRLDTRTRAQRAVSDNARFIMEFLAKEIRNGHIDYTAFPGGVAPTNCGSNPCTDLYLINQDNEAEHIFITGTNLVITKAVGTTNLNSSSVLITSLKFLISPTQDPLTPAKLANEQPHTTVIMQIKANSSRDPVLLNLQSTFSEDYYPSRQ